VVRALPLYPLSYRLNPDNYILAIKKEKDYFLIKYFLYNRYGERTWEWDTSVANRGPAHALFFAFFFAILRIFGIDSPFTLVRYKIGKAKPKYIIL
jgi:hypothetical protein